MKIELQIGSRTILFSFEDNYVTASNCTEVILESGLLFFKSPFCIKHYNITVEDFRSLFRLS